MSTKPKIPPSLEKLPYAKRLERTAALLVEEVTGVTLVELDPGGGGVQLPDFEIRDAAKDCIGALEVTTTTRSDRARFNARVQRENWRLPGLMWSWSIHTVAAVDVRSLREQLGPVLREMELQGPPEDWVPQLPGMVGTGPGAIPATLAALGVAQACAWHRHDAANESWVSVQRREPAGSFSTDRALTTEVQAELDKQDNQAKLRKYPGRGELFVWLDMGEGAAAALTLIEPPWRLDLSTVEVPILPEGITTVWAATGMAEWPRPATALLLSDGTRWEILEPPELR